jgi:hypothetical protein
MEELAVAILAGAVTTPRDGMRMDVGAVAIGDRATAMRDGPVTMHLIDAALLVIGVALTQPRVPLASEYRPVALTPLPDRSNTKSHRCCVRCASLLERWRFPFSRRTIRHSSVTMVVPRRTMRCGIVSLRAVECFDRRDGRVG